jgi:glyoxylase-like metal-dependent hydrolase (beta-lactamase superfamily II)
MKEWHTKNGYAVSCIMSGRSNVFLLSGNVKNILIDTGPGYKWRKLQDTLNQLHINKIDLLILTHTHFDHAGNASRIKNEYGSKVVVSKYEAKFLESGVNTMVHGTVPPIRYLVKKFAPILLDKLKYNPCKPDILVDQHFDLKDFGFQAYIMHTPGHSPGSQCVIVDNEIAIAGDTMFGVFPRSVFPPFADDEDEMFRSWLKLLATGCYFFLPSHGSPDSRDLLLNGYKKRRS